MCTIRINYIKTVPFEIDSQLHKNLWPVSCMEPGSSHELLECSDLEGGERRDSPGVSAQGIISIKRSLGITVAFLSLL